MEKYELGVKIYFEDLKPEIQEELLKYYGIKEPKELNWDVFPMVVM